MHLHYRKYLNIKHTVLKEHKGEVSNPGLVMEDYPGKKEIFKVVHKGRSGGRTQRRTIYIRLKKESTLGILGTEEV